MNYECWLCFFSDGRVAEVSMKRNAHEALFVANDKTADFAGQAGRVSKIVALFQNNYPGNRHRRRRSHKGQQPAQEALPL